MSSQSDTLSPPLPRSVWVLSWISFFADVSSEMVYPILPLFVVQVLGASRSELGLMEGTAVLLVSVMSAYAGFRSDQPGRGGGRVKWIRIGYGMPVIGKSIMAFALVWPMVAAGRLFDRFGKGLRGAPRDALISESVTPDQRGRAFGLHRTFDTAGALLGVLISAFLLWWLTGVPAAVPAAEVPVVSTPAWVYRVILGIGAALGLAAFILSFLVPEARAEEPSLSVGVDPASPRADHRRFTASYWSVLAALAVFSFANSSDAFLMLRFGEIGFTPWQVVMLYAAYNVTYAGLSYPIGALSDRLGRWQIISLGWLIYLVVYAALAWLPMNMSWAAWPLMGLYGIYMALTDGVGKALIADHAPREAQGLAMGIFYATTGFTTLTASLVAGALWDHWGSGVALSAGAVFAGIALVAVAISRLPWKR